MFAIALSVLEQAGEELIGHGAGNDAVVFKDIDRHGRIGMRYIPDPAADGIGAGMIDYSFKIMRVDGRIPLGGRIDQDGVIFPKSIMLKSVEGGAIVYRA